MLEMKSRETNNEKDRQVQTKEGRKKEEKMKKKTNMAGVLAALLVGLLVIWMPGEAVAANTEAGTDITNSATLDYNVGGVDQTDIISSPDGLTPTGVTTDFKVDRKILVTVADQETTYALVSPGATDQPLQFTVTNSGNDTQDFSLSHAVNGSDPYGGTENFDATYVGIYIDDGDDTWEGTGTETASTCINDLASGEYRTIYIVNDIGGAQSDGDISAHTLTATAYQQGGGSCASISVENPTDTDDPTLVDVVFGDVAGDTDAAVDGKHSDSSAYKVSSAQVSVAKTATTVWDPFNYQVDGTTDPKAIPGAIIEYTITISNASGAAASAVLNTIQDAVPANTTLVTDQKVIAESAGPLGTTGYCIRVTDSGTNARVTTTTWDISCDNGDADTDGGSFDGTTLQVEFAGNGAVPAGTGPLNQEGSHSAGELKADETVTIKFQVTVD